MKFDFSNVAPENVDEAPQLFRDNISTSLEPFIRHYKPYLGKAMTQFVSSDNPIKNFVSLVSWVSDELAMIKEAKKGKKKNPLADVKGVCPFQFATYCCHAPNAQRSIYWPMNTMFSRTSLWIRTTMKLGGEAGSLVL